MTLIFQSVLSMSITASFVILAVLVIRFFLKRTSRIFSYLLWIAVLFRLLCPVSFESNFSIFNLPKYFSRQEAFLSLDNLSVFPSQILPSDFIVSEPSYKIAPFSAKEQAIDFLQIISFLWLLGLLFILGYGLFRYFYLSYQLTNAVLLSDNIYETDRIHTPFILGLRKPKIYLPLAVSKAEREYVLLHEKTHIRRKDYWIKFLSFFVLSIYWFHPLVWLSIHLLNKDIEISCDESVLKHAGEDIRKGYSNTLLRLSIRQSGLFMPIGFGEVHVKERIKHILKFKKGKPKIRSLGFLVCFISVFICISNAKADSSFFSIAQASGLLNYVLEKEATSAKTVKETMNYKNIRKELTSLDDITDEMILNNKRFLFPSFSLLNINLSIPNGYQRGMQYFSGMDALYLLQTEQNTTIQIKYESKKRENYKLVFIYPNDSIVELAEDTTEYFLPAGKTKIMLIGVKAKGSFQIQIEPQGNIEINKI